MSSIPTKKEKATAKSKPWLGGKQRLVKKQTHYGVNYVSEYKFR